MAVCRWIAVLVMVFAAQSAAAATLGVAWDTSTEPGVTGYRVYVGTWPGERAEAFDVGRFQTSFMYTAAVAGQRYYFSVATQANGLVGRPSAEVSGSIDLSTTTTMQPQTTNRAGVSTASAGARSPVVELASGLGPVTSLVADDAGGALFIEDGSRVRKVSRNGGVEDVALDATPGERYLSMTLDPDFSNTGHVFIAVESLAGAAPELSVVRHRLLGGALGESARVIAGLPSVGGATRIAVSADHIFVAQTGRVLRFSRDGSVPHDQASGSPLWSAWDGPPEAAIWDQGLQGLWVAGRGAAGGGRAVLLRDAGTRAVDVESTSDGRSVIVLSRTPAQVLAHSVTARGLASTDLATGIAATLALPLAEATASTWIATAGGALVVIAAEGAGDGADAAFRLVRVYQ